MLLVQHPDLVVDLRDVLELVRVDPFRGSLGQSILHRKLAKCLVSTFVAFVTEEVHFVQFNVFVVPTPAIIVSLQFLRSRFSLFSLVC